MPSDVEVLRTALTAFASSVRSGSSSDATFLEQFGWNCPAVTRHDLAAIADRIAGDLAAANITSLSADQAALVQGMARQIQALSTTTVPYLYNGNNPMASAACLTTLAAVREALIPIIGWQMTPDLRAMPNSLAKRLRGVSADLDQLIEDKRGLEDQVALIREAHATAESLPIDMQALRETRARIEKLAEQATALSSEISDAHMSSVAHAAGIAESSASASKLVEKCEEAYRITTTKGLAASFEQRAGSLRTSLWLWVAGLALSLGVAAWLGSVRVESLIKSLAAPSPQASLVSLQIVLALVSVGAPVWFAWLATRQIGQRFRLAEDYAFKASVAKAYEGYRREAVRIDPEFEARLFSSALDRLDEAPLRLVEQHSPGSPWHDLFARKGSAVAGARGGPEPIPGVEGLPAGG